MQKYLKSILGFLTLFPCVVFADLTGVWHADDGGTYYLRQSGNQLDWFGEQAPTNPRWSNIFHAKVMGDHIKGEWLDVPKGDTRGKGYLSLSIEGNGNVLKATSKSGGFGGSKWTREGYTGEVVKPMVRVVPQAGIKALPPTARVERVPAPVAQEDCVNFNPANIQVKEFDGRWKIVDGSHWIFDFESKRDEAQQAYRLLRRYRVDQSCYVGRPNPSFKYLLVGGSAPQGGVSGEDCIGFDPNRLSVRESGGRWKIMEGANHSMFDFADNKGEAEQAYAVIRKHGFTHSCYVGRPDPSLTYLRK